MGRKITAFLGAIKFQHTVFALPFAVVAMVLATREGRDLNAWIILWILVAMVSARTAAMCFNRFADAPFDRLNPRTRNWPTADGRLSRRVMAAGTVAALVLFFMAAGMLNKLCLILAPVAAVVLLSYSLAKRFTWMSHLWLGAALGISAPAAWLAVRGEWHAMTVPLLLGGMVAAWVAGFDLIYACSDAEFDRAHGLASFPSRFGVRTALIASAALHAVAAGLLFAFVAVAGLGLLSWAVAGAVTLLLVYEHWLVRPSDLSRAGAAFFTVNGVISLLLAAAVVADVFL